MDTPVGYSELRLMTLTTLSVGFPKKRGKPDPTTLIEDDGHLILINSLLKEGWELIRVFEHRSQQHDMTAIVALLGKRK